MKPGKETILALSLLAAVLIANAIGLAPELTISRVDLNDNAMHFPLVAGMVEAIERGTNPFDWWAAEWSLGYPMLRTYQPLAHAIVAAGYFAFFKSVSLMTVFVWVRYLSVALLPLTFFVTARLLSLSPLTAAAAAMLSPMISTPALYGLEYGSYLWAGSGLFTQAVACHFALLSIGFAYGALRYGRRLALTGMLLGLTFLSHFIYGYIAALTLCLLAVIPDSETPRAIRIGRTVWLGAVALALSSFELVPLMLDSPIVNHSRWENSWKWDSFGAGQVFRWMLSGELLDHGRLPVLSLLAMTGAVFILFDFQRDRPKYPERNFIALGSVLWILMFFGRPFWGPLLALLGVSPDMQLHRVIGGVHIFLVLIAAIGLAAIWRELSSRTHVGVAALVTILLFFPMVRERAKYLSNNNEWGKRSLAAYNANRGSIDSALAVIKDRGGRAYAGLAAAWGGAFKIGDLPFYAYISRAQDPALSFMYHSMSLASEIMTRFNEGNSAHYRLFDVRTVVAPAGVELPNFLAPIKQAGPLRILAAPGGGDFDVVDVFYTVRTTKYDFYDINDRWLQSPWVANRQHLLLDFFGDAPAHLARLGPGEPLPASVPLPSPGEALAEQRDGPIYRAEIDAARASYVLFKTTWHPNWKVLVDGEPVRTAMLSPGFVGIPVIAGRHSIQCRYEAQPWQSFLAIAGGCFALLAFFVARPVEKSIRRIAVRALAVKWVRRPLVRDAAFLILLALPVSLSLFTSRLSDGHDATEYLPRQVEFHEDVSHGNLLPRWAPDLSQGAGQPFFLFNPPMFYYVAEIFKLLGFDFVTAINLACVVIVLASAAGMFLLAKLYFDDAGGWLAAAAYLYAPYFAVDLYVRSALAEFAAFPFFVWSLYGFGAHAKLGSRRHLLIGAAAYAGVMLSHNPAALLFTPLLAAFIVFASKSWVTLRQQAFGFTLGLGLAAFVWIPGLTLNSMVQVKSLLEGYSRYTNHFVYLHQLFYSPWGYGLSIPGDQDGMSFGLGATHLLLCTAAAFLVWRREAGRRWFLFFAGAAAILSFLMLQNSKLIWDWIPLLQIVAFPWRLLGPVAVCIAAIIAPLGPALKRRAAFSGVMMLLIAPNLSHLQPEHFREADLNFWTPQEIARRGIEVTSRAEYRPRWMLDLPAFRNEPIQIVSGEATVQQTGRSTIVWSGTIHASTPATAEMSIAYFPGWRVRIDGADVPAWPADRTGLIRFQISAGDHRVEVAWTRVAKIWAGDVISLLALCILIAAAV
jgi:hypothetical protein